MWSWLVKGLWYQANRAEAVANAETIILERIPLQIFLYAPPLSRMEYSVPARLTMAQGIPVRPVSLVPQPIDYTMLGCVSRITPV